DRDVAIWAGDLQTWTKFLHMRLRLKISRHELKQMEIAPAMRANLQVLLCHGLLASSAPMNFMQAPPIWIQILPLRLLVTAYVGTVHKSILAIFIDVRLNMSSLNDFLTSLTRERA